MPQQFASPTLSPFTAADGENLALHEWPVAADTPLRGLVVLVHGLGEHAGRYGAVAEQLNTWGFPCAATTTTATANPPGRAAA